MKVEYCKSLFGEENVVPPVPGMAQQLEEQVFRPFRALPETRELVNNINDSKPTEDEIYEAISLMARYKAPGPDEISSELVRADPIHMSKILERIFSRFWPSEDSEDWTGQEVPLDLRSSCVVMISLGTNTKIPNIKHLEH